MKSKQLSPRRDGEMTESAPLPQDTRADHSHESPRRMAKRLHRESLEWGPGPGPFPLAEQLVNATDAREIPVDGIFDFESATESRGMVGVYRSKNGAALALGRLLLDLSREAALELVQGIIDCVGDAEVTLCRRTNRKAQSTPMDRALETEFEDE